MLRTLLQAQGYCGRPVKYTGMMDVLQKAVQREGMRGLYKACTAAYAAHISLLSAAPIPTRLTAHALQPLTPDTLRCQAVRSLRMISICHGVLCLCNACI